MELNGVKDSAACHYSNGTRFDSISIPALLFLLFSPAAQDNPPAMINKIIIHTTNPTTGPAMEAKYDSDVSAETDREEINERRILRKIDMHLLPLVVALHAISLVDRTNISVARISGMDEDLSLETGERVSIVTSTFFIGYILFNIPSNIVIRRIGAARFLGIITVAWGIVTIGIGFVNSWVAAAVLRSFLGVFEAG